MRCSPDPNTLPIAVPARNNPHMAAPLLVVVGSLSMTLVTRVPHIPGPGRSVSGSDLLPRPGGRGACQAVAAARLGASVHLVGRVGADDFGTRLLTSLESAGVASGFVTVTETAATGTTLALEDTPTRQYAQITSPGANALLTPDDVDRALPLIRTAAAVLIQLDIPLETVEHTRSLCHRHRVPILLDPAPWPAEGVPKSLLNVTCLTPNEVEAGRLLGRPDLTSHAAFSDPKQVATDLLALGPACVALKLGEHGALYACAQRGQESLLHVPAFKIKVKDTSSAGDAFTAALAVARAENRAPADMLRFANAAGALACTHDGSLSSLPHRADVEDLCRRWG